MNAVLQEILQSQLVSDGTTKIPLHSNMSREEGVVIDQVFVTIKPDVSLEIGFAYGVSTLFVCDALAANRKPATHIVIDPFQHSVWTGIGLKNVARAGYEQFIDFHEERSEIALPSLLAQGTRVQVAIIDGNHTFDHALIDFFYVNKMLAVGGIVILDDTYFPSVSRVVEHIRTYPAYELFATTPPPVTDMRTKLRRALAAAIPKLRREWDCPEGWEYPCKSFWNYPSCMAFRKIAEDDRRWDWHVDF